VKRLDSRKNELVDLINSIIPIGGLKCFKKCEDGTVHYTMTIEGVEFYLLSLKEEFILSKSIHTQKEERDNKQLEDRVDVATKEPDPLKNSTESNSNPRSTSQEAKAH